MKIINARHIIIMFFVLSLNYGCADFVDLNPPTIVRQDQYFKNQSDFTAAINGLYSGLRGYYGGFYALAEIPSDNTEINGYNLAQGIMDQMTWMPNTSYIQSSWLTSYAIIARSNIILDKIDDVVMDESLKAQYKGEAKFIRGLMYFNLVRFFGDVPLIVHEIKTEEEAYSYLRTPSTDVYKQIEADLQDAASELPETYHSADMGKATKGAAQSLLGKVYITTKQFDEAVPILKAVIESRNYGLLNDYEDVFRVDNGNNKEIVFAVQYLGNGNGEGSNFSLSFAPFGSGTEITSGGTPAGANQGTIDLYNAFEEGDVRKDVAIVLYEPSGAIYTRKFLDRPIAANEGNNDWPVLRYADVLLLYAEALNEMGLTNDALIPLNEVRERAGILPISGINQEEMGEMVQHERRVELCFEGHRWFDLLRTGKMVEVMTAYQEKYKDTAYLIDSYEVSTVKTLFPIPFREISLNPNLTQNDGYN